MSYVIYLVNVMLDAPEINTHNFGGKICNIQFKGRGLKILLRNSECLVVGVTTSARDARLTSRGVVCDQKIFFAETPKP